MLYIGTQITAVADLLAPISEEELLCRINTPNTDVHRLTEQLQTVRSVDKNSMIRSKKDYPILYVVILTLLYDGQRTLPTLSLLW